LLDAVVPRELRPRSAGRLLSARRGSPHPTSSSGGAQIRCSRRGSGATAAGGKRRHLELGQGSNGPNDDIYLEAVARPYLQTIQSSLRISKPAGECNYVCLPS
ncbi:unnamed protein product, partial [Urochloa humidicola]